MASFWRWWLRVEFHFGSSSRLWAGKTEMSRSLNHSQCFANGEVHGPHSSINRNMGALGDRGGCSNLGYLRNGYQGDFFLCVCE